MIDAVVEPATLRPPSRIWPALAFLDRLGRIVCLAVGVLLGVAYAYFDTRPTDAATVWVAGHALAYYGSVWTFDAPYVYPPPLAQLAGLVPWALFIIPWMVLVFASLWYATRWLAAPILLVGLVVFILGEDLALNPGSPANLSVVGNIQAIVAAAIVMGFRHPAAWAFVVLTKIGPGLGLAWFLVRREWRSLAVAGVATAVVVAISLAASPRAWADFVHFAVTNYATQSPMPVVPIPLFLRVPMALGLVVWGALTNRRWTVPIAAGWSALALYESSFFLLWAAALPLFVERLRPSDTSSLAPLPPQAPGAMERG